MRIISGELKGKKLSVPLDKSTRPLRDMVRESIFNILDHSNKLSMEIYNSKVTRLLISLYDGEEQIFYSVEMGDQRLTLTCMNLKAPDG